MSVTVSSAATPSEADLIALVTKLEAADLGAKNPDLLADSFSFTGPVVGPLPKDKFLEVWKKFDLKKAMPDMASKHRHFFVDFTNPRRLWAVTVSTGTHTGDLVLPMKTIPATGKKYESAPEVQSYRFDEAGRCTALTAGYVADRDMGNTGGLGALFGILHAIGHPLPDVLVKTVGQMMKKRGVQVGLGAVLAGVMALSAATVTLWMKVKEYESEK